VTLADTDASTDRCVSFPRRFGVRDGFGIQAQVDFFFGLLRLCFGFGLDLVWFRLVSFFSSFIFFPLLFFNE
jgi:hypothetical protein